MKRVIALLLCLVLAVVTLAACADNTGDNTHTHTYRDTWSSDANNHWYDATCDCEDAPIIRIAHVDKNNDGMCDHCEFTDHTHTYAETWTADCTNHYKAANCGHIVAGIETAAHIDEDEDGKCDVCAYIIKDIHVHLFADEWTTDGEYHWYAPICEHANATVEKLAHEIDNAGYCTVCEQKVNDIDLTDVGIVLAAAVARNDKVVGGNVLFTQATADVSLSNEIYFTLGNNNSYINYISNEYGMQLSNQQWFEVTGTDSEGNLDIFAIQSEDGALTFSITQGTPEKLNGYNYTPSTILGSADSSTLANTLYELYLLSANTYTPTEGDGLVEKNISYDEETGFYTMNFTFLNITEEPHTSEGVTTIEYRSALYTVEATFTIDANYVIDYAEFTVTSYISIGMADDDYTIDYDTKVVTMKPGAAGTYYQYTVAQVSGERTYTSGYPKVAMLPSSFDLFYNGELADGVIETDLGKKVAFTLGNIYPTTADIQMLTEDDFQMRLVKAEDIDNPEAKEYYVYYDSTAHAFCFYGNEAGIYVLSVSYEGVSYEITVKVKGPAPKQIAAYRNVPYADYWDSSVLYNCIKNSTKITEVTIKPEEVLQFVVALNPTTASQLYTCTIDNGTLTEISLTNIDYFNSMKSSYPAYEFSSATEGDYTVTMTSTEDPTLTATLVIHVSSGESGSTPDDGIAPGATSFDVVVTDNYIFQDLYTYTATVAGDYTFHVPAGVGMWEKEACDTADYTAMPDVDFQNNPEGSTFTVTLEADEAYTFYVGALTKDVFTITVDVPQA